MDIVICKECISVVDPTLPSKVFTPQRTSSNPTPPNKVFPAKEHNLRHSSDRCKCIKMLEGCPQSDAHERALKDVGMFHRNRHYKPQPTQENLQTTRVNGDQKGQDLLR